MSLVSGESGGLSAVRGRMSAVSMRQFTTGRGGALTEVRFTIDNLPVCWRSKSMLVGESGDELIIAGNVRETELLVLAWWNESKRVGGSQETWGFWAGATMVTIFCALGLSLALSGRVGVNRSTISAALMFLCGWVFVFSNWTTRRAIRLVQRVRDEMPER